MQIKLKSLILKYVQNQPDISTAVLYGSILTEKFKPESDIDIAILCPRGLTSDLKLKYIQEISVLTGRSIDLVDLKEIHAPLLQEVLVKGEFIKLISVSEKEKLIRRMHDEVEDFLPLKKRAQILKLKRFVGNG